MTFTENYKVQSLVCGYCTRNTKMILLGYQIAPCVLSWQTWFLNIGSGLIFKFLWFYLPVSAHWFGGRVDLIFVIFHFNKPDEIEKMKAGKCSVAKHLPTFPKAWVQIPVPQDKKIKMYVGWFFPKYIELFLCKSRFLFKLEKC